MKIAERQKLYFQVQRSIKHQLTPRAVVFMCSFIGFFFFTMSICLWQSSGPFRQSNNLHLCLNCTEYVNPKFALTGINAFIFGFSAFYFLNFFSLLIWLCWVFTAAHRLSLVAMSGGYSLLVVLRLLIVVEDGI